MKKNYNIINIVTSTKSITYINNLTDNINILKKVKKLLGVKWLFAVYTFRTRFYKKGMKDQLNCNLITKAVAGLCNKEEEKFLKAWLNQDPQNHQFYTAIQFQVAQLAQPISNVK